MTRLLILVIFFPLFAVPAFTQADLGYSIQQYTTDNGMPSNGIKGLQWDEKTGFLWVATEAGIARFNGIEFKAFTRSNMPGLSQERMAYIIKSNEGSIYTADAGSNIFFIRSNYPEQYHLPEIPDSIGFKKRHFLTASGAETKQRIAELIKKTGSAAWENVLQPGDGSCIIITANRTCFYQPPGSNQFIESDITTRFSREFMIGGQLFFVDPENRVYAAKNNLKEFEEVKIISPSGSLITIDPGDKLLYWEVGMKNPLFFSGSNAWLLHYRDNTIQAELICSAVPSYSFIRAAQYSEKNKTLFIGTDSKGIIVITGNRVVPLKKAHTDIFERNAYYAQVELPGNNILTSEGHIIGISPATGIDLPIRGKFGFSVHQTADSLLWYSQVNEKSGNVCLHSFNYRTRETIVYRNVIVTENFAVAYDRAGIFVATNRGLGLLQEDSVRYLFNFAPEKSYTAAPLGMLTLSPGVFIIASCNGLIRYNTNTAVADTLLDLPGYCIRNLWQYRDYVFIGTYGKGFYIWKNEVLKPMPLDKNGFLAYTHCFVPDDSGFCWMSTNRGLFKAKLEDLLNAYEKNTPQVYYHYYGKNDGMDITEMNGGCAPCALVMNNKTISFPTMDGLLWVKPEQANPLLPEGDIFIDEFRAGSLKINPDSLRDHLIRHTTNDIQMKILFSAWCNKENIYLDYRLSNNSDWIPVEQDNESLIRLNNLPPGKYTVTIRKMNGFGTDNYSYKEIVFTISTPWHQQWWFYLLCVFASFGLVALYLQIRTRQYKIRQRKLEKQVAEKTKELQQQNEILEKNNTIKTRLISIISHDIVTPLKFVTVAGKNLLEKRKQMSEELQQETIQEMTNTSQELQLLSTNILNWIKYQNENRRLTKETFNIHEMVRQVLGILNSLALQKNLRIVNEIDKDAEIYQFYEPLKILVYNLLTNAINFSEKGTIAVRVETGSHHVTVSVKDEGVGMTPEKIQSLLADHVVISSANVDNRKGHGLGFLIIKDLLKTMGASLHIESKKGVGSTISIIMPV
ncbi:MAG TPA: ATP-binding protein [Chitinophagaceae bacterium]